MPPPTQAASVDEYREATLRMRAYLEGSRSHIRTEQTMTGLSIAPALQSPAERIRQLDGVP